jgi:hypothetical protein
MDFNEIYIRNVELRDQLALLWLRISIVYSLHLQLSDALTANKKGSCVGYKFRNQ